MVRRYQKGFRCFQKDSSGAANLMALLGGAPKDFSTSDRHSPVP